MDPSLDLLPTALFSPSKAAQQRAQAQEWHSVDAWLSAKYQGRSVPQFERNEDTLRALMALSRANERADEERDVLWSVQREALTELKAENPNFKASVGDGVPSLLAGGRGNYRAREQTKTSSEKTSSKDEILNGLANAMSPDGKASLDALVHTSVALDVTNPSAASIASAISDRTVLSQTLSQQLASLTAVLRSLERELGSLRSQIAELRSPAFQAPLALQRQTLDWTRNTKQLRTKLTEYQDRLAGLGGQRHGVADVGELVEQEGRIRNLEGRIQGLRATMDAYLGLPPEKETAVKRVKDLERELGTLSRKVDTLFEGLVDK